MPIRAREPSPARPPRRYVPPQPRRLALRPSLGNTCGNAAPGPGARNARRAHADAARWQARGTGAGSSTSVRSPTVRDRPLPRGQQETAGAVRHDAAGRPDRGAARRARRSTTTTAPSSRPRDMFFLATADADGHPMLVQGRRARLRAACSTTDDRLPELRRQRHVPLGRQRRSSTRTSGLLFIDFERRRRLRLNGVASIDDDDPLLAEYPRGPARGARSGDRGVPELPALHPRIPTGRALAVHPTGRLPHSGAVLEDTRLVAGRSPAGDPALDPGAEIL